MSEIQTLRDRSFLNNILLSANENRLRAGWRLILHTGILLFFWICLNVVLIPILVILDPAFLTSLAKLEPEYMLLGGIAEAIAVTTS